jgi:hypothetical protein
VFFLILASFVAGTCTVADPPGGLLRSHANSVLVLVPSYWVLCLTLFLALIQPFGVLLIVGGLGLSVLTLCFIVRSVGGARRTAAR